MEKHARFYFSVRVPCQDGVDILLFVAFLELDVVDFIIIKQLLPVANFEGVPARTFSDTLTQ